MLARFALPALLSLATLVHADPVPTAPGPGEVDNPGKTCHIAWTPDPKAKDDWKKMAIELMTGDNWNMVHLTTVTTVDGTSGDGTFDFDCPAVDPPAPIYFYQFSAGPDTNATWSTRFTITDADGKTVAAPNDTQPDGQKIGWGVGKLLDPSSATPPPGGSSNSSNSSASSAPPSSSASPSTSSNPSSTSGFTKSPSSSSGSPTSLPNASTNTTGVDGAQPGGALGLNPVASLAAVALTIVAASFTAMF